MLVLATVSSRPASAGILHINRQDEIAVGRQASAQFEQKYPIITSGPQYDRVQRIARRIVAATGCTDLPFTFKIANTPAINAVTFPGGFIYVFRGLLDTGIDDDGLACVLGHECTHAVKSHAFKILLPMLTLQRDLRFLPQRLKNNMASRVMTILMVRGVGRRFELEADRIGVGYAYHAGFDPRAMIRVLQMFERMDRTNPSLMQELLATHPPPAVRIRALEPVIARLLASPR